MEKFKLERPSDLVIISELPRNHLGDDYAGSVDDKRFMASEIQLEASSSVPRVTHPPFPAFHG